MDRSLVERQVTRARLLGRLPTDAPFTSGHALRQGLTYADLRALVGDGVLSRPIRSVYHSASLPDTTRLRVEVLKLAVPRHAVVTDRSAAWVWGAERVLEPGAHLEVPRVSMFCLPGTRLRNGMVDSGQRDLTARDVTSVDGLRVTTPLRTACDAGRLLHRDQAIGVMDALAALGSFDVPDLEREARRFRGFRGVVQLRALAPLVVTSSGSPGESTLRLRFEDAGLPRPACQVEVPAPGGGSYYIDLGLPEHRFGAEYFGAAYHGPEEAAHDEARLAWIRHELGWIIVVLRRDNVYGPDQDAEGLLLAGARAAGLL